MKIADYKRHDMDTKLSPQNIESYMTLNPAYAYRCGNYNPKIDACEPWFQIVLWFH